MSSFRLCCKNFKCAEASCCIAFTFCKYFLLYLGSCRMIFFNEKCIFYENSVSFLMITNFKTVPISSSIIYRRKTVISYLQMLQPHHGFYLDRRKSSYNCLYLYRIQGKKLQIFAQAFTTSFQVNKTLLLRQRTNEVNQIQVNLHTRRKSNATCMSRKRNLALDIEMWNLGRTLI